MSRRALDLSISAVALAVMWPVLATCALAVKLSSPGAVLHRAERVGRGGAPFTLYKFRTMVVGAAAMGPGVTAGDDPRVTRIGRLLRKSKLDELPQLFNVVLGDMSLVGPRPEDARYVKCYTEAQREILAYRPGITSPASVRYRDEESLLSGAEDLDAAYLELMGHKIDIDLEYLRRRSSVGDLKVLASTARAIVAG